MVKKISQYLWINQEKVYFILLLLFIVGSNALFSLKELVEGIFVVWSLIRFRLDLFKVNIKKYIYVLSCFLVGAVLSHILSPGDFNVLKTELPSFRWILFFLGFTYLSVCFFDFKKALKWFPFLFFAIFVADLVKYFLFETERAGGLTSNPINFANMIAPFVLVIFAYCLGLLKNLSQESKLQIGLSFGALVLGLLLIFLSQTRGVILAVLVAFPLVALLFSLRTFIVSAVFIGVFLVSMLTLSDDLRDRVISAKGEGDYSKVTRLAFWNANIELWKENKIFGVGYGINNFLYYDQLTDEAKVLVNTSPDLKVTHAHNQYVHYLAGGGLWGISFFVFFIFLVLKDTVSLLYKVHLNPQERVWVIGLIGGLVCFLLGGLTEANFTVTRNKYIFVLLASLAVATSIQFRSIKDASKEKI